MLVEYLPTCVTISYHKMPNEGVDELINASICRGVGTPGVGWTISDPECER